MTDHTKPLEDKRLEAIAQIFAADIDDPSATIERARAYVSGEPSGPLNMLQTAIRETLAGELAAMVNALASNLEEEIKAQYGVEVHPAMERRYNRDMQEVLEARALLTQFKEMSE